MNSYNSISIMIAHSVISKHDTNNHCSFHCRQNNKSFIYGLDIVMYSSRDKNDHICTFSIKTLMGQASCSAIEVSHIGFL